MSAGSAPATAVPLAAPGAPRPDVSFEFFPPQTAQAEANLWVAVERLAPLAPRFVSVTYGAGGSTRERTHATLRRIKHETALTPAAHLTCVGATRDEVDAVARDYWSTGIRHIVALRGDPPAGTERYIPHPGGYAYQRVYNDDRSIDGLMMARNHDSVLVPEGYHPVVSAHGYTTYYLNFLAGSAQSLANSDDPAYEWVKGTWTFVDPRLPIVHHGMEG